MTEIFPYQPIRFDQVPGWQAPEGDDTSHLEALGAFVRSQPALETQIGVSAMADALWALIAPAQDILASVPSLQGESGEARRRANEAARTFFEDHFTPHSVEDPEGEGLFTGYYEPVLKASRRRSDRFSVPLLRRPADLVTLIDDAQRAVAGETLTHARAIEGDLFAPYATRQEIEQGALDDMDLAFLYLSDPVDAYFLHIQGSGLIELDDGDAIRVGYDGKNGHPYTSVGQYVLSLGVMPSEDMTLDALKVWLKADHARGQAAMWQNKSYIFFRELGPADQTDTLGARGSPLTPGRSLAVDANVHELGLPIFVSVPDLVFYDAPPGFARLMIAQDVGSAIRGRQRADVFYGSGDAAGHYAGATKHKGVFYPLIPNCRVVS